MKATLLSLLAAVSVFGGVTPATAQVVPPLPVGVQPYPGERCIVSYLTNGAPVYAVYQAVGFDAMGYPIYQWVTQPTTSYVRPSYGYGYRSYQYRAPVHVRPGYVRPNFVTPHLGARVSPPVHHGSLHMGHSGGGHAGHGGGHHH